MITTKVFLPQSHSFHPQISQTLPSPSNSTGVHLVLEGEDSGTFYRPYPTTHGKTHQLSELPDGEISSSAHTGQETVAGDGSKGKPQRVPRSAQLKSCSGNNTLKLFISISYCLDRRAQPPVIEDLFKPGVSWPMNHPTLRWVLNSTFAFSKQLNEFWWGFFKCWLSGKKKKKRPNNCIQRMRNKPNHTKQANSKEKIKDCFRYHKWARKKFS